MKQLLIALTIILTLPHFFCGDAATTVAVAERARLQPGYDNAVPTGMIAYIRGGEEIRLIDSNGQHDRLLWSHPSAREPLGIFDLAWRPDGKELAFSSGHEAAYSLYHADLYSIRPDGSGLRKITNPPAHQDLASYKKGTVAITVRNQQYSFDPAQSSAGVFIVNVIGAEEPQQVVLPPGASKTLVFKKVADFGDKAQAVVATYGRYRWFMPGTDVVAGQHTKAPDFIITGDGIPYFGAFRPVWKYDGSELSYRDGLCLVMSIPAVPPEGEVYYESLFGKEHPQGSCVWDWGPNREMADLVLYSSNEDEEGSAFYLGKQGSDHDPSTRQVYFSDIRYQIPNDVRWLPDGSGFLYSATSIRHSDGAIVSNIFHYDLKTKKARQVTRLGDSYARRFCISPSGRWIVYERCKKDADDDQSFGIDLMTIEEVDLWMIGLDGTGERLLVKNGQGPGWSR